VWNTDAVKATRWTVGGEDAGQRLDKFLARPDRLGSRSKAADAIDRGKIFVNEVEAGTEAAGQVLADGDDVRVWMDRPGSGRAVRPRRRREGDLVIVYEDASLLVVDKPAGLLAVPLGGQADRASLADLVAGHLRSHGRRTPQVVHRIDRDTSGLVVFAKDGPTVAISRSSSFAGPPTGSTWPSCTAIRRRPMASGVTAFAGTMTRWRSVSRSPATRVRWRPSAAITSSNV
jgi:23S rRNA-/tRNA-specific pseudouridylate synthase